MKKQIKILLLLLPLLFVACNEMDNNPWRGKEVTLDPTVIVKIDGELEGLNEGVTRIDDKTLAFVLYAPNHEEAYILGDFNGWVESEKFKMEKEGDLFWIYLHNFDSKKQYICQYSIDGYIRIADPYATIIIDPNDSKISSDIYPNLPSYPKGAANEIAMLVSTGEDTYSWAIPNFKIEHPENMVIYELLIRDFTDHRSIKAVQEKLPYLKELGIDAIELLPINEFEGNNSWGYNPSYFFATDKAYGTTQAYKEFIDACHQQGIGVIIDLVLNHAFDQCALVKLAKDKSGKLMPNNPWFNLESPNTDYSWGQDFNHESEATQQFVDRVCEYWLTEFNVDGIRFDFTKGFTNTKGSGWNYDASRIRILKRMFDNIQKVNRDAVVIFEHLTDNSEEMELADYGIYLWGNMNYQYNQATMGYGDNDLSRTFYKNRGWVKPHLVSYMESHDEERIMFKNLAYGKEYDGYSCKDLNTALKRVEAAAAIYFSIPGPKMIWQFGERGYEIELNSNNGAGRLNIKPPHWEYMDNPNRKALYDAFSKMINLRKEVTAFSSSDVELNVGEGFVKKVVLKHPSGSVYTVANFDVVDQPISIDFDKSGNWTDCMTGEIISTNNKASLVLPAGGYKIIMQK